MLECGRASMNDLLVATRLLSASLKTAKLCHGHGAVSLCHKTLERAADYESQVSHLIVDQDQGRCDTAADLKADYFIARSLLVNIDSQSLH